MELYDAIDKRHSVRAYEAKQVDEQALRHVLDTGRVAPSARNLQNWKFVVVRDADTRAALAEASEQKWMKAAPVIIAVVGLTGRTMFCDVPADPIDCAIAIDHMTLAAVAEGLGSCWIGHFKQDECREILGIPSQYKIIEMLTLGCPKGDTNAGKSRKPFDEVVCWDRFSE